MPRWAGCEFPQYEHYVTSPVQFMSSLKSRCWTHPFLEWMNSNFVFHLRHMPTFLWCGRDERSYPTKRPCIVKKNIITMVAHLCNLWCINYTVSSPQANLQDTPLHEDHCSNRPLMKREMFFNKIRLLMYQQTFHLKASNLLLNGLSIMPPNCSLVIHIEEIILL